MCLVPCNVTLLLTEMARLRFVLITHTYISVQYHSERPGIHWVFPHLLIQGQGQGKAQTPAHAYTQQAHTCACAHSAQTPHGSYTNVTLLQKSMLKKATSDKADPNEQVSEMNSK